MSLQPQTRSPSLQTYKAIVYSRALHPEFFQLQGRQAIQHFDLDCEAWIMPGGHALRLSRKDYCITELVTPLERDLPTNSIVSSFPCAGDHDFEHVFDAAATNYFLTVHTETLNENLYRSSYEEIRGFVIEESGLLYEYRDDEGGACLSAVCLQRFNREIHVEAYHLAAMGGLILRTQTLFECR